MSSSQSYIVTPGVSQRVPILSPSSIEMMLVSNGSQYDLQWSGFGTQGQMDIPAGQQVRLFAKEYNSGVVNVLPVDTLGVGGVGSINVTVYNIGEPQPEGSWPVTIPAQRVIAATTGGAVIADHLINQGNAGSAAPIIEITEAGATGDQIFADNQGNFYIQQYQGSVLTTLLRTIAGVAAGLNNVNVLLGDALRQVSVQGALGVGGPLTASEGIGTQTSFFNTTGIECSITSNSTSVGMSVDPQTSANDWRAYVAGGNGALGNTVGLGFEANALLKGFHGADCMTGLDIDGLCATAGIDLTGMGSGSGPPIHTGSSGFNGYIQQEGTGDTQILAAGGITLNGGTSGTAKMYQFFRGNVKVTIIQLASMRTAGVDQHIVFPSAYTTAYIRTMDAELMSIQNVSNVDQGTRTITALPTGAGLQGTSISSTTFNGHGLFELPFGGTQFCFKASWASAHTGLIYIEGI